MWLKEHNHRATFLHFFELFSVVYVVRCPWPKKNRNAFGNRPVQRPRTENVESNFDPYDGTVHFRQTASPYAYVIYGPHGITNYNRSTRTGRFRRKRFRGRPNRNWRRRRALISFHGVTPEPIENRSIKTSAGRAMLYIYNIYSIVIIRYLNVQYWIIIIRFGPLVVNNV